MDFSSFRPGQAASIKHLEGPLLISAGAGSGKTFTLTQRVAWALLPGSAGDNAAFLNSIDDVLVITFTEKAAAEIKDRIRSTLRAEGMLAESLKVDSAWISTIHGMCSRILREHALEIGIDPAFRVLNNVESEALRSLAISMALDRMKQDSTSPYKELVDVLGVQNLTHYLSLLLGNAATLSCGLEEAVFAPCGKTLAEYAQELLGLCQVLFDDPNERVGAASQELAASLQEFLESRQEAEYFSEIVEGLSLTRLGTKTAAELKAALKEARLASRVVPYLDHAKNLVALAREVNENYQEQLRALGQMDMVGLIRTTLEAFDNYPEIAQRYTSRFKLIMVDEFQDTSQLQIDMISRIAGPSMQRLCTVGDAQQSIYRFQGADIAVYLKHKQEMQQQGAKTVQLDENFRSHADILAFVRKLCGQSGYFQEDFLDLQAATEGSPFYGEGPRVELAYTPVRRGETEQAIKAEARHIARRFAQLREAGHPASSMVVLMGRLTKAAVYAQALRDEGFACLVTGGSRYFESVHVQSCLSLLDVLANPYNSESLLTLLTSEVLPINTSDLLVLATHTDEQTGMVLNQNLAKGLVRSEYNAEQASPLLIHAQDVLVRAWGKLGKRRPAQIFLETVLESGWLLRLEKGGIDAQAKAADVLKFVRLLEDAQNQAGYDMARVARTLHETAQASGEKPGALSVENLDAVRILTVHASKGLEFPIVAVADCYDIRSSASALLLHNEEQHIYVSLQGPGGNAAYAATGTSVVGAQDPIEFRANMLAVQKQSEYEEKKRLLYVACTRASAALILAVRAAKSKTSGYPFVVQDILAGLLPGQADFPETNTEIEYGGSEPLAYTRIELDLEESVSEEEGDPVQQIAIPLLKEAPLPVYVPVSSRRDFFSYTSLAHEEQVLFPEEDKGGQDESGQGALGISQGFILEDWNLLEDTKQFIQDRDKASSFGSALHRACEWLAHSGPSPSQEQIDHAIKRCAQEFSIKDKTRLERAFTRWYESDARKWANSFDTQQAELPFALEFEGAILEGEIDLFCATGDKAGVVDYKTGGSPQESQDALYAKHLLQAQCYAYAVLCQGYSEVELKFVRVEQACSTTSEQPQVVEYRFTQEDTKDLFDAIRSARKY